MRLFLYNYVPACCTVQLVSPDTKDNAMTVRITTNHNRREVVDGYALPPDVRTEFDYVDWSAVENGTDSVSFVRYRGDWFDLGDTEPGPGSGGMPDSLAGWDAYVSETYFSGVVFRWVEEDGEWSIIVGRYFADDTDDTDTDGDAR